jgi:acyl carrier protein
MQREELINIVSGALVASTRLSIDKKINTTASLRDCYGLDSMSSMKFLMTLEKRIPGFEVDTDMLEEEHLENIESVATYVSSVLNV